MKQTLKTEDNNVFEFLYALQDSFIEGSEVSTMVGSESKTNYYMVVTDEIGLTSIQMMLKHGFRLLNIRVDQKFKTGVENTEIEITFMDLAPYEQL